MASLSSQGFGGGTGLMKSLSSQGFGGGTGLMEREFASVPGTSVAAEAESPTTRSAAQMTLKPSHFDI